MEKVDDYEHAVGHCYRCKTVIEPTTSVQWFVAVRPLADKAVAAVRDGRINIYPKSWYNTFYSWMDNIRDWCISRQIWWGHRIPAWTCSDCGELIVASEDPTSCPKCASLAIVRETDVLDTWFSSALWPFSTMGWPDDTKELATFYPTSVLITSFDILFFWVARMMMMGLHFMDEVPFKDVYLHALVRDKYGKKMSKSTGNVIDPLVVMKEYGTDAMRFTLTAFAAQGREIRLDEERIEGYRHFINKIWNAARFALMHVADCSESIKNVVNAPAELPLVHQWILSRTAAVIEEVRLGLDEYRFNDVASTLYQFIWREFCDWYLEWIKADLFASDLQAPRAGQRCPACGSRNNSETDSSYHAICFRGNLVGFARGAALAGDNSFSGKAGRLEESSCGREDGTADGCDHRYPQYPFRGRGASVNKDRGLCCLRRSKEGGVSYFFCCCYQRYDPVERLHRKPADGKTCRRRHLYLQRSGDFCAAQGFG